MDLTSAIWRKASYRGNAGNCVEVVRNVPGIVAVRDSKDPDGSMLICTPAEWRTFTADVRTGHFNVA